MFFCASAVSGTEKGFYRKNSGEAGAATCYWSCVGTEDV
ncbi:hypothetical protein B4096_0795 [Heyndrickxia coagulans]|nr:hypothetical protein B4096_0795 [Heyndrickxia coagulans]